MGWPGMPALYTCKASADRIYAACMHVWCMGRAWLCVPSHAQWHSFSCLSVVYHILHARPCLSMQVPVCLLAERSPALQCSDWCQGECACACTTTPKGWMCCAVLCMMPDASDWPLLPCSRTCTRPGKHAGMLNSTNARRGCTCTCNLCVCLACILRPCHTLHSLPFPLPPPAHSPLTCCWRVCASRCRSWQVHTGSAASRCKEPGEGRGGDISCMCVCV